MEEALRAVLVSDAGVSGQVATRVYWGRRSQSTSVLPAVVLEKISAPRDYTYTGPSNLIESRVQADCFGESYANAKAAARSVISALSNYSGTQSGVVIQRVTIENERDFQGQESGADRYLFATSVDLLIWHDE